MSDWMTIKEALTAMNGDLIVPDTGTQDSKFQETTITDVSIDSRNVSESGLFFAIKGARFDAHDFVPQLENKCVAAIVEKKVDTSLPQILVKDVIAALGDLAKASRTKFTKPVVALTGSNGKTTLKEMIGSILSVESHVLATKGNLNNHIGMPLTLLNLRAEHDYAVIEMGANHFNEIDYLTNIATPDIAVINNAGKAHLEGFGSVEGVAKAKGEIFVGLGTKGIAIINADDKYADYWKDSNAGREIVSFGMNNDAVVQGELSSRQLKIVIKSEEIRANLKLLGRHNAMNALAASAVCHALGVELSTIKAGLEKLNPVKGRLCPVEGINDITILDDTYNANPDSVIAAFDVLADRSPSAFVLGDLGELGENAEELHRSLGLKAKALSIETMYCLGEKSKQASEAFGSNGYHFDTMEDLILALRDNLVAKMTVLVKGSRKMKMERVVSALSLEGSCSKEGVA